MLKTIEPNRQTKHIWPYLQRDETINIVNQTLIDKHNETQHSFLMSMYLFEFILVE